MENTGACGIFHTIIVLLSYHDSYHSIRR